MKSRVQVQVIDGGGGKAVTETEKKTKTDYCFLVISLISVPSKAKPSRIEFLINLKYEK
jgi:hypothetical protein